MRNAPYPKREQKNNSNGLAIYLLVFISILGLCFNFYSVSLLKDSIKKTDRATELMVASVNDFVEFKKKAIIPNTTTQPKTEITKPASTETTTSSSAKEVKPETKQQTQTQDTSLTNTQENKPADTPPAQPKKTYVVNDGDTLFSIYLKTGITVEYLKEANNLSSNIIQPGQQLYIE